MKVKAAVLYELGGRLEVEDIELADPEVLVKVSAAGVCHSDISVFDGVIPFPLPAVLGHEGSGVRKVYFSPEPIGSGPSYGQTQVAVGHLRD